MALLNWFCTTVLLTTSHKSIRTKRKLEKLFLSFYSGLRFCLDHNSCWPKGSEISLFLCWSQRKRMCVFGKNSIQILCLSSVTESIRCLGILYPVLPIWTCLDFAHCTKQVNSCSLISCTSKGNNSHLMTVPDLWVSIPLFPWILLSICPDNAAFSTAAIKDNEAFHTSKQTAAH